MQLSGDKTNSLCCKRPSWARMKKNSEKYENKRSSAFCSSFKPCVMIEFEGVCGWRWCGPSNPISPIAHTHISRHHENTARASPATYPSKTRPNGPPTAAMCDRLRLTSGIVKIIECEGCTFSAHACARGCCQGAGVHAHRCCRLAVAARGGASSSCTMLRFFDAHSMGFN